MTLTGNECKLKRDECLNGEFCAESERRKGESTLNFVSWNKYSNIYGHWLIMHFGWRTFVF